MICLPGYQIIGTVQQQLGWAGLFRKVPTNDLI